MNDRYLLVLVLFLSLSFIFIAITISCSLEEEDTTPPPQVQQPTPEPEPEVSQFTLTVTAGEGGTVSTEGGTYDEGTEVTVTANSSEGFGFGGWTNFESNSSTIKITLSSNTSITANFITLPSLSMVRSSTSIFTKSNKDTLTFETKVPGGYNNIEINSENGDLEIVSQPELGATSGEIKLTYNPQAIVNVDYTITIAGYDDLSISVFDSYENNSSNAVRVRTQPEPFFHEMNVDSRVSMNYYPNRLHIQRIRYDNKIDNAYFDPCIMGDLIEREYNRWGHLRDNVEFPLFTDINGDGYFDIICFAAYQDAGMETYQNEDGYLELYLYEDGKFVYSNLLEEHRYIGAFKILPGDFDNDGDIDLYIFNSGLDKAPFPGDNSVILENKMDDQKFVEHILGRKHFTHGASLVDIDQDGDLDIFESGRSGMEGFSGFYINNGNFQFEEQSNFIVGSNVINSTFLTTEFNDIDNDGMIDKVGAYVEYSNCPEYLPKNVESCPNFNPVIFWGEKNNSLSFKKISDIPKVENFGLPLAILFYDLDNDNRDEIIISRKGGNSYNDPNNYQGVYIQICKIDMNRVVTDVTNEFIDDNIITDKTCNITLPNPIYLFDLDNNGLVDLYRRSVLFGFEVRWEWNGSKFIKVSP